MEQRARGTLLVWAEPFTTLRVPKIFNLRTDPYERADITSNTYYDWLIDHVYLLVPAQDYVGKFLMTFKDYPQRQKAASFNLDEVLEKLKETPGNNASAVVVCPMAASRTYRPRPPLFISCVHSRSHADSAVPRGLNRDRFAGLERLCPSSGFLLKCRSHPSERTP